MKFKNFIFLEQANIDLEWPLRIWEAPAGSKGSLSLFEDLDGFGGSRKVLENSKGSGRVLQDPKGLLDS